MIIDILKIQKNELESKRKEKFLERTFDKNKFETPLIKVIIGPRRAGKSFFAIHFLTKKNINFGYINFDDEGLADIKDYNEIISGINLVYDNPKILLFDEIQNLEKWELFVNRLQRQGYDITITGSNSNLLSKELATHLTGRHALINIFPLSFNEYVQNKNRPFFELKEMINKYVIDGGYPEPFVRNLDYKDYLTTLFDATIYKDIIKRYKIRNPKQIEDLAIYLISNIANEYSYNSLTNMDKIKSPHTTEKYLGYLEESFILFSLNRFSYKIKEQLSSNKKIYCIDNGFIQAKAFKSSTDIGRLYENCIACKLKKDEINGKLKFYYWKNSQQEEVDFVIKEGLKVKQLIQVCFDLSKTDTKNREIRALIKAGKELKCNNLLIITEDTEKEEKVEWFGDKAVIKFIPLWKWLSD